MDRDTGHPVPYFKPNVAAIKFRSRQGTDHPDLSDFEEYDEVTCHMLYK